MDNRLPHQYVAACEALQLHLICGSLQYRGSTGNHFLSLPLLSLHLQLPPQHVQLPPPEVLSDTAIVGCVSEGNDLEHKKVITNFSDWCGQNYLRINATKDKELLIDFRRKAATNSPGNIQGLDIETVDSDRYLGVHLNNKLSWTTNTDVLYKQGQSRLYLMRRLRSFYGIVVASALFYAVVFWRYSATGTKAN